MDGINHGWGRGFVESNMPSEEERSNHNIARAIKLAAHRVDLTVHKCFSDEALAKLFVAGQKNFFDFIFIDGSHQAPDVPADAVLAFVLSNSVT